MLNSKSYFYYSLGFIFTISLVHVLLSQQIGFGVDEAHYALYGLKPDLSYFDHPPLMGWFVALLNVVTEINELSLRAMTTLFMALNSLLLYVLARRVLPNQANSGFVSVVLFNLGIMVQLVGWGIVPDVFLMNIFLLLALLIPSLNSKPSMTSWLALGCLMGLSALSKYTAIAAPIALSIYALKKGYLIVWLKQPGLWLAILLTLVVISPVLIWNAQHDWASFIYQIDHGSGGAWSVSNLLKTLISHILLYSPLLVLTGFLGLFLSSSENDTEQFVRIMFYCYLGMVFWAAGHGALLPHWGIVAYLFLAPIAAKHIDFFTQNRLKKLIGGFLAVVSLMLFFSIFLLLAFRPVDHDVHKAYYDVLGWKQAGLDAQELAHKHEVDQILVDNWTHASRIAWYSSFEPVRVIGSKPSQYDVWYGRPLENKLSLLVLPTSLDGEFDLPESFFNKFDCSLIKEAPFILKNEQIVSFRYYLCSSLQVN